MAQTVKHTVNFMDVQEADLHRLVQIDVALDFYILLYLSHSLSFRAEFHSSHRGQISGVSYPQGLSVNTSFIY